MDPRLRRVTRLPLTELWNDDGPVAAEKGSLVGPEDVREFLRAETGPLVDAFIGMKIRWFYGPARYEYWRTDLRPYMVEPKHAIAGFPTPDHQYFIVYEWRLLDTGERAIVAEGAH